MLKLTDLTKAGQSDQLEDSINYVEVYEIVESIMTGEKHNLLERLGALIADSLYQHYQGIVGLSVTVRKPSVPIAGILDYVEGCYHKRSNLMYTYYISVGSNIGDKEATLIPLFNPY